MQTGKVNVKYLLNKIKMLGFGMHYNPAKYHLFKYAFSVLAVSLNIGGIMCTLKLQYASLFNYDCLFETGVDCIWGSYNTI